MQRLLSLAAVALLAGVVAVVVGAFNWFGNSEPPLVAMDREGI